MTILSLGKLCTHKLSSSINLREFDIVAILVGKTIIQRV